MARKIITCTACKARFDVARYPAGSRVRCGRCSQVLTVPGESADRTSGSKSSTAGQARRSPVAKGAGAARPAGAMAPAPSGGIGGRPPATGSVGARSDRDPLLGEMVHEQYRVIRKLGEGGYGAVYEAHDVQLERRMAIKVMLRNRAKSREYVTKFLREARTAAQLSHPNVVGVHGVGFDKVHGIHYLAMEYVEGRTIHDILQERGPIPMDESIEYIVQSCRGLAAAHERNIIHRDIKPGNLMITPGGALKIADFGLAKVYDPDGAQSTVIGTPYFMPPEQFEGKARDGRTDIYALGVTFYYMLTLKRPHTGTGPAQILLSVMTKEPPSICEHRPELDERLWPIVMRMIHRDPDQRYDDCNVIIRDLEAFRGGVDSDEEPVYCPSCGVANPMDEEACTKCGASLLETCPVCGAEDLAGTRFCGDCGSNIPEARAVAALVEEARALIGDGLLDSARERILQAQSRAPESLSIAEALRELEARREEWIRRRNAVREQLATGRAAEARELLEQLREEYPELDELAQLEADVKSTLAAQDPVAAANAEAHEKGRALEDDGRIREALVAWRGLLVLSPDDEEARDGERRLSARVEKAETLFAEATECVNAGDPETAVERLLEANTILPGDPLIEGRMEEARAAAAELNTELESIRQELAGEGGRGELVARLIALQGRFPGATALAAVLREAESAGREASQEAVRERLAQVLVIARAAEAKRHPREAAVAWREACGLEPQNTEAGEGLTRAEQQLAEFDALVAQSRTLLQSGDPEGALERSQQALEIVATDPAAQAQSARARTSLETMRHEAERVRRAIADDPDDEILSWAQDLATRFSGASLAADVLAETEAACREAADKESEARVQKLLARAVKLEQEGNVRVALKTFADAVGIDAGHADAAAGQTRVARRIETGEARAIDAATALDRGDPATAADAAKESLDLLPDQREAAVTLARARSAVSEIERIARSLRETNDEAPAAAQLARFQQLRERYPAAPRCVELTIECERVLATARTRAAAAEISAAVTRARQSLAASLLVDAEAACAEVFTADPENADARAISAQIAARRTSAAQHLADGEAAMGDGRYAAALRSLTVALEEDPQNPGASELHAECQQRLVAAQAAISDAITQAQSAAGGGVRAALAAWEAVLELDPAHTLAAGQAESLRARITRADAARERGLAALTAGDPVAAIGPLRDARAELENDDDELTTLLARAESADDTLRTELGEIEAALGREGELDDVADRARQLAEQFAGSEPARRLLEKAERAARERRRALAVVGVRALHGERRYGEAVALAERLRAEGIETPELLAAESDARLAMDALDGLRSRLTTAQEEGQLEDARDACREILVSIPDDRATRSILAEIEETLREVGARRDQAERARRRGDIEEALVLYREVLELHPQTPHTRDLVVRLEAEVEGRRALLDTARDALLAGRIPEARQAAGKLLDQYPEDSDAQDLRSIGDGLGRALEGLEAWIARLREAGETETAERAAVLRTRILGSGSPTD